MTAGAARWTCAKCAVSVGRIDGEPSRRPPSWTKSEDGLLCLSCSRTVAADTAAAGAPTGCSAEERSRLRRRALIEFEISRDPEAPDRRIAQACRTSTAAVAAVRGASG
jgi:hypothetical protein